jgi:uncharacterized protein (DUF305 family)
MTTLNRRYLMAILGAGATLPIAARAQDHGAHHGSTPEATPGCHMVNGTPQVVPYESDIPFDQAYIDTMIPHHASVIDLATAALDVLEDERLVLIAEAILDTQPGEIDQLKDFRLEWYGSAEPEEMTHEMMMVTMGDTEAMAACMDDHMGSGMMGMDMDMDMMHQMDEMGLDMNMVDMDMAMMDGEALVAEFEKAEDKDLGFIDLVVPHHMMAVHQSWVGLQLAEHEELKELCQDVIDAQTTEIKELLEIRKEIA